VALSQERREAGARRFPYTSSRESAACPKAAWPPSGRPPTYPIAEHVAHLVHHRREQVSPPGSRVFVHAVSEDALAPQTRHRRGRRINEPAIAGGIVVDPNRVARRFAQHPDERFATLMLVPAIAVSTWLPNCVFSRWIASAAIGASWASLSTSAEPCGAAEASTVRAAATVNVPELLKRAPFESVT